MVDRLVEAALATPGVNAPREALAAAFAYAAEPVEDLTIIVDGREQISPARLTPVRGVNALTLSIRLLGCAGITWERNERNATRWASPADPAASGSRWMLPPVRNWSGPNGRPTAALSITMESADHVADVVRRASQLLAEGDGHRRQDLTADLLQNGQEEPCLMVAQAYRTPEADFWALVTVKGNNRTKSRHQILNTDQAALLTASDVTTTLREWTDDRNAELSNAGAGDHPARQALQVAAVEAKLVLGCDEPELLYSTVQSGNRRDHIHAPLAFEAAEQYRAVGRRVLEEYHAAGIIDAVMLGVLTGDLPITRLPHCPPGAGICEQRELRRTLLLAEFFPAGRDRRSPLIRQAMAEPFGEKLEEQHVRQRSRAYSALCSASWPQAWNPRVDDATVGLPQARAGIAVNGGGVVHLLSVADTNDEAFAELVHYTAPQWIAAFRLADADRGSMGAQASRGADAGTRIRRSMPSALNALSARRVQAVALLREMAAAMEEDRAPRRVNVFGEVNAAGEPADQAWFDDAFPKGPSRRRKPRLSAAASEPVMVGQEQQPLFHQGLPPAADRELAERNKARIRDLLTITERNTKELITRRDEADRHAAAAGMHPTWDATESERISIQIDNIARRLDHVRQGTRTPGQEHHG